MRTIVLLSGRWRGWARFVDDRRGMSAVEFAMLLPLMLTLYLGGVEISQGIGIDRKVTLTTRTVADLTSQVAAVNNAEMTNILNASASVMTPYPTTTLSVVVTCLTLDAQGTATVSWSDSLNGTAHGAGETVTVPTALAVPNTTLIWSEVNYAYQPTIGYVVTGTLNLRDEIYMRPRLSDTVTRTAS